MSELINDLIKREQGVVKDPNLLTTILESMREEERQAVIKSLDLIRNDRRRGKARVYSCAWLSTVLTNHGYPISRTTIRRYLVEKATQ